MNTVKWPDLHFGPVNLWTVMSADMFYATREEQYQVIWYGYKSNRVVSRLPMRMNNQLFRNISLFTGHR